MSDDQGNAREVFALLYLVIEELLVEAQAAPEKPWITSLFFVGFLTILLLDEIAGRATS